MTYLSIIIPVLNEADWVVAQLQPLQELREAGHEVIVVDGGSQDNTAALAQPWCDRLLTGPRGRALQMHLGSLYARSELLIFLHLDSRLPANIGRLFNYHIPTQFWGRFDIQLSGKSRWFRVIENAMNWRSRITGIATGDQALFVHYRLYRQVGGLPPIALMEDIALSKSLRKIIPPRCLQERVTSSSRRWEQRGIIRTMLWMWLLRLLYWLRVSPAWLEKLYYGRS